MLNYTKVPATRKVLIDMKMPTRKVLVEMKLPAIWKKLVEMKV